MTHPRALRRRGVRVVLSTLGVAAVAIAAYKLYVPFELALNTTPSIPRGLYLAMDKSSSAELAHGDAVCFGYAAPTWAAERAYFQPGRRLCKYVAGLPGDRVVVEAATVKVFAPSGELREEAELAQADSKGRALPADALASGVIPAGQLLVLAPANKNSLDSRYLGLIARAQVTHEIWPVWVRN